MIRRALLGLAGLALVAGCASSTAVPAGVAADPVDAGPLPTSRAAASAPPARIGRPARSERVTFVPQRIVLPDGSTAAVLPAETAGGVLQVPENVRHVGWWDGGAASGDPFGSVVIAGHVDSATEGVGYFARLLRVRIGEEIDVSGGGHRLRYRVVSVQTVAKQALSSDSRAFAQDGPHRLVLITCTGSYHRDRGGYDSNLVITARPLGLAR